MDWNNEVQTGHGLYRWDTDWTWVEGMRYCLDMGCRNMLLTGHDLYTWGNDWTLAVQMVYLLNMIGGDGVLSGHMVCKDVLLSPHGL